MEMEFSDSIVSKYFDKKISGGDMSGLNDAGLKDVGLKHAWSKHATETGDLVL